MKSRPKQSRIEEQLTWSANVVEYVNYIHSETKVNGNCRRDTAPRMLKEGVPILGPRFLPPAYLHLKWREVTLKITPDTTYLKPLNIVHPFYYLSLRRCPRCHSEDEKLVHWEGWTPTGYQELHGISREECALGYQLRCYQCEKRCEKKGKKGVNGLGQWCFATTTLAFWESWEFWKIPRTFMFVCARACAHTYLHACTHADRRYQPKVASQSSSNVVGLLGTSST